MGSLRVVYAMSLHVYVEYFYQYKEIGTTINCWYATARREFTYDIRKLKLYSAEFLAFRDKIRKS